MVKKTYKNYCINKDIILKDPIISHLSVFFVFMYIIDYFVEIVLPIHEAKKLSIGIQFYNI